MDADSLLLQRGSARLCYYGVNTSGILRRVYKVNTLLRSGFTAIRERINPELDAGQLTASAKKGVVKIAYKLWISSVTTRVLAAVEKRAGDRNRRAVNQARTICRWRALRLPQLIRPKHQSACLGES